MSDTTPKVEKKLTKAQQGKWTRAQALGFWFLLTATLMFWSGVYLGSLNTDIQYKNIEQAKSQAVEQAAKSTSKQ